MLPNTVRACFIDLVEESVISALFRFEWDLVDVEHYEDKSTYAGVYWPRPEDLERAMALVHLNNAA